MSTSNTAPHASHVWRTDDEGGGGGGGVEVAAGGSAGTDSELVLGTSTGRATEEGMATEVAAEVGSSNNDASAPTIS